MGIKDRKIPWYVYVLGAWVAIAIMAAISAFCTHQPVRSVMTFSFYQIFAILIPGLGYAKVLGGDRNNGGLATIFIAYALGYCNNIVLYYLLFMIGGMESNSLGYFLLLTVQCILSISLLVKDKTVFEEENSSWRIPLVLIVVVFLLELFAYAGYNLLPPYTDGTDVWRDLLFWIGNTVSLKLGYPPVEFRTLRENFSYHFFSSMQLASESIVTGIPVAELSVYFSYIQAIIILIGGLYCLLIKFSNKKLTITLFSLMLLFTSGYEGITRVSYVSHMYFSQYAFDYGMGFTFFLLYALIELFDNPFEWKRYSLACFLFAALMGIKATFACIALVGIGCICFFFLLRREWKKSVVFGVSILCIFAFLYLNVCNISGYSGISGISKEVKVQEGVRLSGQPQSKEVVKVNEQLNPKANVEVGNEKQVELVGINIGGVIHISKSHWEVCENLAAIREKIFLYDFIPAFVLEIIFFVLFVTICNPCLYILIYLIVLYKIIRREKFDYWDISCFAMMLVGMLIGLYIQMYGKSNVYFAMATYPIALMFVAKNIHVRLYSKNYTWSVIAGCLILFGFNLFFNHAAYEPIMTYCELGREKYYYSINNKSEIEEAQEGISTSEYEALLFVREEIEPNEIIVCVNERTGHTGFEGIITEHKVVNCMPDNVKGMLEKWESDYLVVSCNALKKIGIEGKKIFENDEWSVVKIF